MDRACRTRRTGYITTFFLCLSLAIHLGSPSVFGQQKDSEPAAEAPRAKTCIEKAGYLEPRVAGAWKHLGPEPGEALSKIARLAGERKFAEATREAEKLRAMLAAKYGESHWSARYAASLPAHFKTLGGLDEDQWRQFEHVLVRWELARYCAGTGEAADAALQLERLLPQLKKLLPENDLCLVELCRTLLLYDIHVSNYARANELLAVELARPDTNANDDANVQLLRLLSGEVATYLGELDSAEVGLRNLTSNLEAEPEPNQVLLVRCKLALALVLMRTNRPEDANTICDEAVQLSENDFDGDTLVYLKLYAAKALTARALGKNTEANDATRAVWDVIDAGWGPATQDMADVYRLCGEVVKQRGFAEGVTKLSAIADSTDAEVARRRFYYQAQLAGKEESPEAALVLRPVPQKKSSIAAEEFAAFVEATHQAELDDDRDGDIKPNALIGANYFGVHAVSWEALGKEHMNAFAHVERLAGDRKFDDAIKAADDLHDALLASHGATHWSTRHVERITAHIRTLAALSDEQWDIFEQACRRWRLANARSWMGYEGEAAMQLSRARWILASLLPRDDFACTEIVGEIAATAVEGYPYGATADWAEKMLDEVATAYKAYGEPNPKSMYVAVSQAMVNIRYAQFEAAENDLHKAIDYYQSASGSNADGLVRSKQYLATLLLRAKRPAEAKTECDEAYQLLSKVTAEARSHERLVLQLLESRIALALKENESAAEWAERALANAELQLPPVNATRADCYEQFMFSQYRRGHETAPVLFPALRKLQFEVAQRQDFERKNLALQVEYWNWNWKERQRLKSQQAVPEVSINGELPNFAPLAAR